MQNFASSGVEVQQILLICFFFNFYRFCDDVAPFFILNETLIMFKKYYVSNILDMRLIRVYLCEEIKGKEGKYHILACQSGQYVETNVSLCTVLSC